MKRRVIWIHLPLTVLMVMVVLLMGQIPVDGLPATERWRRELMDELTMDEWPVGEEDTNSNDDLDPMDLDERIYEVEALLAERHEQQVAMDTINVNSVSINNDNNDINDEDEEEDDVDQDDFEEEEDDDDNDRETGSDHEDRGVLEPLESTQPFDSSDEVTLSSSSSVTKATSKLQQQEELDLEVLDQSIVDTLRLAIDTVKQDRPQRFIPLDENTPPPATIDSPVGNKTSLSSPSSSFSISLLFASGFHHVSASWTSYWILGILLSLITLSYRKFRQSPIRDYHHLPSYSVYKQKSSVD